MRTFKPEVFLVIVDRMNRNMESVMTILTPVAPNGPNKLRRVAERGGLDIPRVREVGRVIGNVRKKIGFSPEAEWVLALESSQSRIVVARLIHQQLKS